MLLDTRPVGASFTPYGDLAPAGVAPMPIESAPEPHNGAARRSG